MITLDYKDRRPLYEQVIERFQDLMFREVLMPDDKMPSVRSLATDLSINPNTIQRAYTELERQGYIYSVKGKGSFVADSGRMKSGRLRVWERSFDGLLTEAGQLGLTSGVVAARVYEKMDAPAAQANGKMDAPEAQAYGKTDAPAAQNVRKGGMTDD